MRSVTLTVTAHHDTGNSCGIRKKKQVIDFPHPSHGHAESSLLGTAQHGASLAQPVMVRHSRANLAGSTEVLACYYNSAMLKVS